MNSKSAPLDPAIIFRDWHGDAPIENGLEEAGAGLRSKHPDLASLEADIPIAPFAARLAADYDVRQGYGQLKPALKRQAERLRSVEPDTPTRGWTLALLHHLIADNSRTPVREALAPEWRDAAARIKTAIRRGGNANYELDSDIVAKDVAIALGCVAQIGGRLVDPGAGIPRRIVTTEKPLRVPGTLMHIARMGGFAPLAEFHTHNVLRHRFTPESWTYAFQRLPALFAARPDLKGIFGAGWFFDPALERIGSNMAFAQAICRDWGGRAARIGPGGSVTGLALTLSPERQKLYDDGVYRPEGWYMIVPKQEIIARAGSGAKRS